MSTASCGHIGAIIAAVAWTQCGRKKAHGHLEGNERDSNDPRNDYYQSSLRSWRTQQPKLLDGHSKDGVLHLVLTANRLYMYFVTFLDSFESKKNKWLGKKNAKTVQIPHSRGCDEKKSGKKCSIWIHMRIWLKIGSRDKIGFEGKENSVALNVSSHEHRREEKEEKNQKKNFF